MAAQELIIEVAAASLPALYCIRNHDFSDSIIPGRAGQMNDYSEKIRESADFLRERLGPPPGTVIVAGTGLGAGLPERSDSDRIDFREIPGFPNLSLEGHPRTLQVVRSPERVAVLLGRHHLYEGLSAHEVVFPVRVMAEWGVERFFLSNAAAALREEFREGDLMLIRDHIGLFMESPLPWPGRSGKSMDFTDMSAAYDPELRRAARVTAEELGMKVAEGVYLALPGPAFETPAEIRFLRAMGVDAVGMSTVPEVVALRSLGRKVLGICCFTNHGAGMKSEPISHSRVMETAEKSSFGMMKLLLALAGRAAHSP